MRYISHRGNLIKPDTKVDVAEQWEDSDGRTGKSFCTCGENSLPLIERAIAAGFDVEVDVWYIVNSVERHLMLGHDRGVYPVDLSFFEKHKNNLWIHCKNIEAVVLFEKTDCNYFWHEKDKMALTSKGWIWTADPTVISEYTIFMDTYSSNSVVARVPTGIYGVCSDYIQTIRDIYEPTTRVQ